jgi:PAS domain S-box-containing protein
VYSSAGVLVAIIAYIDWKVVEVSLGFLYIVPILMASATLRSWQIAAIAIGCGTLREWFSPIHATPGAVARISIGAGGFALAGYFVSELNLKRQLVTQHLRERERQIQLRLDAEQQLQAVIETSPLAILTLDSEGRVLLVNESAQRLLRLDAQPLRGKEIQTHLPILKRFLNVQHSGANLRTTVESRGQRADGEAFLAHVWLSTFTTNSGLCLAAFIWDASENLRDREGTGLDSMMATSRILIGAVSHEIRNLAAAAASAHKELAAVSGISHQESFRTLGTIIEALEKIAKSGLSLASHGSKPVADLGMVLDETRVVIDASFRDVGGTINWKIADRLPLVHADHHSLLQVFLNLARNSHSAMKDTEERTLSVEAGVENEMVLVRFRDTGPGVANPESLFKAFQPGASSTGLGLYISRAVLRSYGGDLHYEPNPDGSCFVVQLWPADSAGESEVL